MAASPDLAPKPQPKRKLFEDDRLAILRAAIDFKKRRGAPPSKATSAEFFEKVKDSLSENLSESQVFNKLRHLKDKLGNSPKSDNLLHRLSVELWPPNSNKKSSILKKDGKDTNKYAIVPHGGEIAERIGGGGESEEEVDEEVYKDYKEGVEGWGYLRGAASGYWKENGLSSVALEEGLRLVDPVKARELEKKWRRLMSDEIQLLVHWSKTSREILVMLHEVHKDGKI